MAKKAARRALAGPSQTPQRVAIYARVSTKEQMEKDTIQNQIDACKRYITGFGLDLIDIYPEDISGTTEFASRPQGARLLSDAAQGRFDTVLCAALDRVGRRALVIHHTIEMFTQAGLLFASVRERLDMATPFGRAMVGIVPTMAELEHAMILERTAQGRQSAAEDGMWIGALPLGYRADAPETRRLVRSDEPMPGWEPRTQAQFVQELYHTIVSGTTASALARQWNREGRQTPGMNYGYGFVRSHGPDGTPASGQWSTTGISVIIHNSIYLGAYTVMDADGQEHTKTIEALVTREVWEAAQAQLLHNRRLKNVHAGTRTYLLRGLMRCGTCGAMYHGRQANYNGRTRTWRYACAHQGHGETPCRSKILDGPTIERQLLEHVRRFLRHPEQAQAAIEAQYAERLAQVAAPATDPARERAALLAALRKAEGSRANLIAFIADTPPAEQSPTLKQTLWDYDTEVTRLTRAVAALDMPTAPAVPPPDAAVLQDLLGGLEARLDELVRAKDLEGVRQLIATLFPAITVVSMPTTRQTRRPRKYEASLHLGFRFDPRHCLSYQEGAVPFIEGISTTKHYTLQADEDAMYTVILEFPAEGADERAAIPPYLGTLCKRGHAHEGTGQSLRDAVTKGCRACDALRRRKGYTPRRIVHVWEQPTYDPERYYLGKLCPQGHDYQGTGQSLRHAKVGRGSCAACGSLRTMAYRNRQRTKVRAAYNSAAAEGVSP